MGTRCFSVPAPCFRYAFFVAASWRVRTVWLTLLCCKLTLHGAAGASADLLTEVDRLHAEVLGAYKSISGLDLHHARGLVRDHQNGDGWRAAHGFYLGSLLTGSAMEPADTELFLRISSFLTPRRIFGVGNAWGFSTIMLGSIFPSAAIDIIDAAAEGRDNLHGIHITREVLYRHCVRDAFVRFL
eukprot:TRINITY_DN19219_c0_g1_i2.p1 TRINITY_DN19219_c0_g1~~TRINITY_DN19219_c0_g1_i2.p1  ORF type:complete len:185 (-),score=8.72 TRINITY_DN19219_c0_g1_i2:148-702(-)